MIHPLGRALIFALEASPRTEADVVAETDLESAFDSDRHHMCGTEKRSMAGGIRYRRQEECDQTLLDSGYSIAKG